MNTGYSVAAILLMAGVTFLTRVIPFLLFDRGQPPQVVLRLSKVLPPAIMTMLVVYCLKGIGFSQPIQWLPLVVACGAVIAVQLWKGNDLLSILGGTLIYMGMLQVMG